MKPCSVCEWRPVYAKGRCRSCYVYHRRHGHDKDETYVVNEGAKVLEMRQYRRICSLGKVVEL